MSEINLNFDLSNTVQQFELTPIAANIELTPVDLSITTAPLAITVTGTGAFYTRAVNNADRAYTDSNVTVTTQAQTITIPNANFAVAEYTLTGITSNSNGGTPATFTLTLSGNTPAQGNIPVQAFATFTTTGVTPNPTNPDATAANATQTYSGFSSNNTGGTNTLFNFDVPINANSGANTTYTLQIGSYGFYPQLITTIPIPNNSNSNTIVSTVQNSLANTRKTLTYSNTTYVSPYVISYYPQVYSNIIYGFSNTIANSSGNAFMLLSSGGTAGSATRIHNFRGSNLWANYTLYTNAIPPDEFINSLATTPSFAIGTLRQSSTNTAVYTTTLGPNANSSLNWNVSSLNTTATSELTALNNTFCFGAFISGTINSELYFSNTPYTTWTAKTVTSNNRGAITAIGYDGTNYYAFANNFVYTSSTINGTYTEANLTSTLNGKEIHKVAITNNGSSNVQVIAVGDNGIILTKPVGTSTTWTTRTSFNTNTILDVATDNAGGVIFTTSSGDMYTSLDHGNTWTPNNPTGGPVRVKYIANRNFVVYGKSDYLFYPQFVTYNRLIIDSHYVTGSTLDVSLSTSTGSNVAPRSSTTTGAIGTQGFDTVIFNDGANLATFPMPYGMPARDTFTDIYNSWGATANWINTSIANGANADQGSIVFTRRTVGGISNAQQLTANYTYGNGATQGNLVISRTSQYNGSNNSTNPIPTMIINANSILSNVSLPYSTDLSTYANWANIITVPGWTDTQPSIGNFTLTQNIVGAVSNIGVAFANAGGATATRILYNDGSGTIIDTNQPYIELGWDTSKIYSPNPYRYYVPWNANASAIANDIRTKASMSGITFSGTGANVVMTSTFNGTTATPTVTKGGTGNANLTIANTFVNGTGDIPHSITINSVAYEIPFNATPQQSIVALLQNFYSDDWRISRTGINQFSLISNQLGSKPQPTIAISAGSPANAYQVISSNTYSDGTTVSITVPQQTLNLGVLSVVLPGITLQI